MARIAQPFARPTATIVRMVPNIALDRPQAHSATRSPTVVAATLAAAFLLASAALSLYLAQVSSVASAGYQLEQLDMERKEWLSRNGQLELELAKRRSLVWSDIQAVQRLGMATAEKPTYINVPSLEGSTCDSAHTACIVDATRNASTARLAAESRPSPGNPAHVLNDVLAWIAALHRASA